METASLAKLKKELQHLPQPELVELLLRIGKYKKENKELLHYLLFESGDEQQYIHQIQQEVESQVAEINYRNIYYAKKSIRKCLRFVNKHVKYAARPETTIELLIHFLKQFEGLPIAIDNSTALVNLYAAQYKRIEKELAKLHEDVQYDYLKELAGLKVG